MPKFLILLLAAVLVGVLAGCQSIPSPADSKSTLLLGKIIFKAVQIANDSASNGIYTGPITFTLSNSDGSKEITLTTSGKGIFMSNALEPGTYYLKKIVIIYNQTFNSTFSQTFNHSKSIVIKPGTINNVGVLDWYFTSNPFDEKKYYADLFGNRDYDLVKDEFFSMEKSQSWSAVSWTNAPVDHDYQ